MLGCNDMATPLCSQESTLMTRLMDLLHNLVSACDMLLRCIGHKRDLLG